MPNLTVQTSAIQKFYVSDLHFNSKTKDYNQQVIDSINQTVRQGDKLYILGDLSGSSKISGMTLIKLLGQIKCKNIYIIRGNHDSSSTLNALVDFQVIKSWDSWKAMSDRAFGLQIPVGLFHFPSNDIHGHGLNDLSICIHGHSHDCQKFRMPNQFDVCWEIRKKPVTLEELLSERHGHHANPYEGYLAYCRTFFTEYDKLWERMEYER